ncbi:hypothetical protein Hanom_Chr08g00727901 [Helianthus anomalus]
MVWMQHFLNMKVKIRVWRRLLLVAHRATVVYVKLPPRLPGPHGSLKPVNSNKKEERKKQER